MPFYQHYNRHATKKTNKKNDDYKSARNTLEIVGTKVSSNTEYLAEQKKKRQKTVLKVKRFFVVVVVLRIIVPSDSVAWGGVGVCG